MLRQAVLRAACGAQGLCGGALSKVSTSNALWQSSEAALPLQCAAAVQNLSGFSASSLSRSGGSPADPFTAKLQAKEEAGLEEMLENVLKEKQAQAAGTSCSSGKTLGEQVEEDEEEELYMGCNDDGEIGGPKGIEPTRFGDWERGGRCTDFQ